MRTRDKIVIGAFGLAALIIIASMVPKAEPQPKPAPTQQPPTPVVPANNQAYQNYGPCPWV